MATQNQDQDHDAYSINEFCKRHSIGRSSFYAALKAGDAPEIYKLGVRTYISKEAAAAWRAGREAINSGRAAVAPRPARERAAHE